MHLLRLFLVALLLTVSACDLPRDPHDTFENAQGGAIHVGVVEHSMWAQMVDGEARGVEPALVRRMADDLGAQVQWVAGPEHELFAALERYQLDLVIGGIPQNVPWKGKVGLTKPYITVPMEVGAPPGMPAIGSISGRSVAVPEGSAVAARVESKGGKPVAMKQTELADYGGLVAAPRWQLQAWGRVPTAVVLTRDRYVWAVPPGENRWLVHIEEFLHRQSGEVRNLLITAAETGAGAK